MTNTSIRYDRPMPVVTGDGNGMAGKGKYPHCLIGIGGSYEVDLADRHYAKTVAWKHAKATGKQFTTRTIDGRFYVWRVK